jgi:S-DNA-T family DNA segregation ATPase FtsK/SpoIIIE
MATTFNVVVDDSYPEDPTQQPYPDAAEDVPEDAEAVSGEVVLYDDGPDADAQVEVWGEEPSFPAIVPSWARSLEGWRWQADLQLRRVWFEARFHAWRSPRYTLRFAVRSLVGTGRGIRLLWGWVFDAEARQLRRQTALRSDDRANREYLALVAQRNDYVKVRGTVAATSLVGAAAGLLIEWNTFPVGVWVEAAAALAVAAWHGGPHEDPGLFDTPDTPIQLDLSADSLNSAFRAAGLLKGKDDDEHAPRLVMVLPPMRDSANSWTAVFDLPRGGGKSAKDVLAKRDVLAAELGVDEIQLDLRRVRAAQGGHAGRMSLWVCDDDPYLGDPVASPLESMESFDFWQPVPLGQDARGQEVAVVFLWESTFYGGLPRRGKTAGQRLPVSAGILDAGVRLYLADGKGGSDWKPAQLVAHRYVQGAEEEAVTALEDMLDEVIDDMEKAYATLRKIPLMAQPDAKLTPDLCRRYGLRLTLVVVDELQEYLTAISKRERREKLVDRMCRIARRGPAAGFMSSFASQRPDADSVPARLRDIISIRFCTQVIDRASSDMVLGEGRAKQGADASVLSDDHKGVGVLSLGADRHVIIKHDYMDLPAFAQICQRGRALRLQAGTLSGDAADDTLSGVGHDTIPQVLSDALTMMRHVEKGLHTSDLLNRLVNFDGDSYGDWNTERLSDELAAAGVRRTTKQIKIDGKNLNGYYKSDLIAAAQQYDHEQPAT